MAPRLVTLQADTSSPACSRVAAVIAPRHEGTDVVCRRWAVCRPSDARQVRGSAASDVAAILSAGIVRPPTAWHGLQVAGAAYGRVRGRAMAAARRVARP